MKTLSLSFFSLLSVCLSCCVRVYVVLYLSYLYPVSFNHLSSPFCPVHFLSLYSSVLLSLGESQSFIVLQARPPARDSSPILDPEFLLLQRQSSLSKCGAHHVSATIKGQGGSH